MNEYNRSDDNLLEEGLSALNLFCYVRDFTKIANVSKIFE